MGREGDGLKEKEPFFKPQEEGGRKAFVIGAEKSQSPFYENGGGSAQEKSEHPRGRKGTCGKRRGEATVTKEGEIRKALEGDGELTLRSTAKGKKRKREL